MWWSVKGCEEAARGLRRGVRGMRRLRGAVMGAARGGCIGCEEAARGL